MNEPTSIKVEFWIEQTEEVPQLDAINDLMLGYAAHYEIEQVEDQLRVDVFSEEDASRTEFALREFDVRGIKWFAEVNGSFEPHRIDGPSVSTGKGGQAWSLWGVEIGQANHEEAITAGVAYDPASLFEWLDDMAFDK